MIRTKLTAIMYAAAFVGILLTLLTVIGYIVTTWPVFCTSIAAIWMLCVCYKSIHRELKSRKDSRKA